MKNEKKIVMKEDKNIPKKTSPEPDIVLSRDYSEKPIFEGKSEGK